MKLKVLVVGKGGCRWADDAVADYGRRLKRWGGVVQHHVKLETFRGDVDAVRDREGERLLGRVKPREWLVAMDERGEALDSEGFAQLLDDARNEGATALVFALGGAYGLAPKVRDEARRVVRLSSLVLNHEVARVVLYEQLYRGFAILSGVPYHH